MLLWLNCFALMPQNSSILVNLLIWSPWKAYDCHVEDRLIAVSSTNPLPPRSPWLWIVSKWVSRTHDGCMLRQLVVVSRPCMELS